MQDPLSDVLTLLRPKSSISVGLAAGGDWAINFPPPVGIKFNAVVRGECSLAVEGVPPVQLQTGDCFLLTRERPFILGSSLDVPRLEASEVYDQVASGVATCNSGADFFLIGGRFEFAAEHSRILFGALPDLVLVRAQSDQAAVLRWSLELFATELRDGNPGGQLLAEHLAHIMLVQILRLHLTAQDSAGVGLLHALADRQISRALQAIHSEPVRNWTVAELASIAGMSRSSFAEAFKKSVGSAPVAYLTQWRMMLAGERLRRSGESVSAVAFSLGYESESAFSVAFKRVMARSPREFRRESQATSSGHQD